MSDTFSDHVNSTIGGNHSTKTVKLSDGAVELSIWDTAGQEQYQALMPLYVHSSDLAIIVVSINDTDSIDAIPKWMDMLSDYCQTTPPMILAVNKCDLVDDPSTSDVSSMIYDKFQKTFSAIYYVSAKSGEGMDTLLESSAIEVTKRQNELHTPIVTKREMNSCC